MLPSVLLVCCLSLWLVALIVPRLGCDVVLDVSCGKQMLRSGTLCTCSHEDVVRRARQLSSIDPLGEPGRLVARILREMMGSHRTGFGTWHNRRETYLNGLLARSHREPQDAPACPSVGLLHLLVLHVISTMTSHKPNRNSEFFDPCLHLKSRTMTS